MTSSSCECNLHIYQWWLYDHESPILSTHSKSWKFWGYLQRKMLSSAPVCWHWSLWWSSRRYPLIFMIKLDVWLYRYLQMPKRRHQFQILGSFLFWGNRKFKTCPTAQLPVAADRLTYPIGKPKSRAARAMNFDHIQRTWLVRRVWISFTRTNLHRNPKIATSKIIIVLRDRMMVRLLIIISMPREGCLYRGNDGMNTIAHNLSSWKEPEQAEYTDFRRTRPITRNQSGHSCGVEASNISWPTPSEWDCFPNTIRGEDHERGFLYFPTHDQS